MDIAHRLRALGAPAGQVGQSAVQNPGTQGYDQAGLLGDVDEVGRRHQPAPRMAPAHERLHTDHRASAQLDDRLVAQREGSRGDRPLQLGPHLEPVDGGQVEPRLVPPPPALPGTLGRVEGEVGLTEHLGGPACPGCRGHADAHRRRQPAGDVERGAESVHDPRGHLLDVGGVRGALDEYRELVPAEPCCRVARPQDAGEAGGDGDQEVVAHAVAHRVVDELEVVQVDEKDPNHTSATVAGTERPLDPIPEQHPVRQTGERVVERTVSELVLQFPLLGDIPQGEHDAAHRRVVAEVAGGDLDIEAAAIRAHDLVAAGGAGGRPTGPHGEQRTLGIVVVPGRDEVEDGCSHHRTRAENRLRGRAGIPDATGVVHDQNDVVGVLHERPEIRLIVAPDDLLAQRHPLECERGLRGENLESAAEREQHRLARGDDEQPHRRSGGGSVDQHERARQRRPEPFQLPGGCTVESVHLYEPARPVGASGAGTEHTRVRGIGEQHRTMWRTSGKQAPDRRAHAGCHVGGIGGRDQVVTGQAQNALTLDRLPVS